MTLDPVTQLTVASARHRARVHDAVLRNVASGAPDRWWRHRQSRHP